MTDVEGNVKISPAFIVKLAKVAKYLKSVYDELKKKNRRLAMAMENKTDDTTLLFNWSSTGMHIGSGRFERAPDGEEVPAQMACVMSACDRDGSVLTGVEGIVVYDVYQKSANSRLFSIAMLFENPEVGKYKTAGGLTTGDDFAKEKKKTFEHFDKIKSEDGGSVTHGKYRFSWSNGAPEQVFTLEQLPD